MYIDSEKYKSLEQRNDSLGNHYEVLNCECSHLSSPEPYFINIENVDIEDEFCYELHNRKYM